MGDRASTQPPVHLSDYIHNLDELRSARTARVQGPPVKLHNGFTVDHVPGDRVIDACREIFIERPYTSAGFYAPSADDVVLDCGANIGVFAIYLSSVTPGIRVKCFEPCGDTLLRLRRNIEANQLGDSVKVFPYAIWDRDTRATLNVNNDTMCTSFFGSPLGNVISQESVNCISLQRAIELAGQGDFSLLKIDVEGSEVEILDGAADIDWRRIHRIVVEYHEAMRPGSYKDVIALLSRYGFHRLDITRENHLTGMIRAARG